MLCDELGDATAAYCIYYTTSVGHYRKMHALQRHNTETSKQIVSDKEWRGHSPRSYIHVSLGDLYIPTIGLPNILQENRWWEYTDCSQSHECGCWDWSRAIPFLGIRKSKFLCSVGTEHAAQLTFKKSPLHAEMELTNFILTKLFDLC